MARKYILVFILTSISFTPCFSQTIQLPEYFQLIIKGHPFFVEQSIQIEIEQRGQERFLGNQDWIVSAAPAYIHQKPIVSNAFTPERIDNLSMNASADRIFWKTGGRLSLSYSSQFTDQSISDFVIPGLPPISAGAAEFYQHRLYASYSHPLLQNKGGILDRLEYDLAGYTIDFAKLEAMESKEGFLLTMGVKFLDWALLTEQIAISKDRLLLAEEQLERTSKMRKANLVDEVDLIRAEDPIRIARQNIMLLEAQWKAVQAELAVHAQNAEVRSLSPEFDLYELEELPAPNESSRILREKSRILQTLKVAGMQLSHQREGLAELSRAQLFLNVGAGLQEGDDEFGGSLGLDKPDLVVALNFRYPLENRTAKTDIELADVQLRKVEVTIKNTELELDAALYNLLINLEGMEDVLTLNREQIESAEQKTVEELKLYNQGRGELTFVIQSRDNEENAKLTLAQNARLYQELHLHYRALLDELLPPASN